MQSAEDVVDPLLSSKEWTEIRLGSFAVEPHLNTVLLLPTRFCKAYQCCHATLSWKTPDGTEVSFRGKANNLVVDGRGVSGAVVSFCIGELPDGAVDKHALVVPTAKQVDGDRSRGTAKKEQGAGYTAQKGPVVTENLCDHDAVPLQHTKVQRIRLATQQEVDNLQEGFYMSPRGRLYWAASETGLAAEGAQGEAPAGRTARRAPAETDARMKDEDDLVAEWDKLLGKDESERIALIEKDYRRLIHLAVLDQHRKGTSGATVAADKARLWAGYAAAAKMMAVLVFHGEEAVAYSPRVESRPESEPPCPRRGHGWA